MRRKTGRQLKLTASLISLASFCLPANKWSAQNDFTSRAGRPDHFWQASGTWFGRNGDFNSLELNSVEDFKLRRRQRRWRERPAGNKLKRRTNTDAGRDRCSHRYFAVDVSVFGAHLFRSPQIVNSGRNSPAVSPDQVLAQAPHISAVVCSSLPFSSCFGFQVLMIKIKNPAHHR